MLENVNWERVWSSVVTFWMPALGIGAAALAVVLLIRLGTEKS